MGKLKIVESVLSLVIGVIFTLVGFFILYKIDPMISLGITFLVLGGQFIVDRK